jgi:response regulator of citrate/malate metabolism
VSAKADPETIRASLKQGAADFLVKPFAYRELMDVVKRHLPV